MILSVVVMPIMDVNSHGCIRTIVKISLLGSEADFLFSELAQLEELRSGTETQIKDMASQLKATEEKLLAKEQELEATKSAQVWFPTHFREVCTSVFSDQYLFVTLQ